MTALGKLTPRQGRFVEEYLKDLNATQAAIRAGYSAKTADVQGPRLLGNVRVGAAIAAGKAARTKRAELSADWVLRNLRKNLQRALQAEPVLDSKGEPTGEYVYAGSVANRALELIGKHLGMFVERHEVTGKDGQPVFGLEALRALLEKRGAGR